MTGRKLPAVLIGALAATGGVAVATVDDQPARPSPVVEAIRFVFGPYANQALRVAWCESRYSVWATNGQYVNVFQMGLSERRRYGWHDAGSPAWMAATAAYRMFVASGYSWRSWTCQP